MQTRKCGVAGELIDNQIVSQIVDALTSTALGHWDFQAGSIMTVSMRDAYNTRHHGI